MQAMSDDQAPLSGLPDPRSAQPERAQRTYGRRIDCAEAPRAAEVQESDARGEQSAPVPAADCALSRGEPLHASP